MERSVATPTKGAVQAPILATCLTTSLPIPKATSDVRPDDESSDGSID